MFLGGLATGTGLAWFVWSVFFLLLVSEFRRGVVGLQQQNCTGPCVCVCLLSSYACFPGRKQQEAWAGSLSFPSSHAPLSHRSEEKHKSNNRGWGEGDSSSRIKNREWAVFPPCLCRAPYPASPAAARGEPCLWCEWRLERDE